MSEPGRKAGQLIWLIFWIVALVLASHFFARWQEARNNPNQQLSARHGPGFVEIELASGADGHYRLSGLINGQAATFLIDTGASDVAIPVDLANRLGLERGAPVQLQTAGGISQGFRTQLTSVQLGAIELHQLRALIAPNLEGQEALLGMNALKKLEFTQKNGRLILRQLQQP